MVTARPGSSAGGVLSAHVVVLTWLLLDKKFRHPAQPPAAAVHITRTYYYYYGRSLYTLKITFSAAHYMNNHHNSSGREPKMYSINDIVLLWIPCPRTNTPRKMSKPPLPSRVRFWKPCSGNWGDCHVWKLSTEPSPHSSDIPSAAGI